MATLTSLAELTRRYIPDTFGEEDLTDRREAAVTVALEKVSDDLPRVIVDDVTSQPVVVSTDLSGWVQDYSCVREAEWPLLPPPSLRRTTAWDFFTDTGESDQIRFPYAVPSLGTPLRVRYTARWTAATIPSSREELVAVKASVILAQMLSGVYGASTDIDVGGSVVFTADDKNKTYGGLVEALESLYRDMLNLNKESK